MESTVKISDGGRVVIPVEYRKQLGMEIGDELIIRLEGDTLRLMTKSASIRNAQKLIRSFVQEGRVLSQELIAERRRDYDHE